VFFFGPRSGVKKFVKKPDPDPGSLFIFGSGRSLCGFCKCHCLITNVAEFRLHRWLPEAEQESVSQIKKKFESRTDSIILEQDSESENVTPANSGR